MQIHDTQSKYKLHEDTREGAEEIAEFLYGDRKHRRRVYHLVENSRLPISRRGSILCARKSVLLAWIAEQEAASVKGELSQS